MGSQTNGLYVLVTGASRGIGVEYVQQLLKRGDRVAAAVRNPHNAPLLKPLAENYGSQLLIVKMDVSDAASIKEAAAVVGEKWPQVDILINNAGITGGMRKGHEETEEAVLEVYKTNMLGPLLTTQAFLPLLQKGGKKQVINISSGGGSLGRAKEDLGKAEEESMLLPLAMAYKASKAALNMQTLTLAGDLRSQNFTVISMCPGWVATDMGKTGSEIFGGKLPSLDAETSVRGQLAVIDGLTQEKSGWYGNYKGEDIPY